MRVVRNVRHMTPRAKATTLTIGNFDGMHRGHRAVIDRLHERASALGATTALMCFEPMPQAYFTPEKAPPRLASLREKMVAARRFGLGLFVCARFDDALATMPAETFLIDLVADRLNARFLIVGEDFRFGAHRRGDIDMIRRFGREHGIDVETVPDVRIDGERVSSTRIRAALANGNLAQAERLLGHAYALTGRVVAGQALGRTLGFPTLNLRLGRRAALRFGVYAVVVDILDGAFARRRLNGAASFGVRPTVDGDEPLLEIYLLNFEGNLYGVRVDVFFHAFVRDEERFEDVTAMTKQMNQDIETVAARLASG